MMASISGLELDGPPQCSVGGGGSILRNAQIEFLPSLILPDRITLPWERGAQCHLSDQSDDTSVYHAESSRLMERSLFNFLNTIRKHPVGDMLTNLLLLPFFDKAE